MSRHLTPPHTHTHSLTNPTGTFMSSTPRLTSICGGCFCCHGDISQKFAAILRKYQKIFTGNVNLRRMFDFLFLLRLESLKSGIKNNVESDLVWPGLAYSGLARGPEPRRSRSFLQEPLEEPAPIGGSMPCCCGNRAAATAHVHSPVVPHTLACSEAEDEPCTVAPEMFLGLFYRLNRKGQTASALGPRLTSLGPLWPSSWRNLILSCHGRP